MDKTDKRGENAILNEEKLKQAMADAVILVYAKNVDKEFALIKIAETYGETIARKVKDEIF